MDVALNSMLMARVAEAERISQELRSTLSAAMWRSGIAGAIYAWRFKKHAAHLANLKVWMRGARASFPEQDEVVDSDEKLSASLRGLGHSLREVHDMVVGVLPSLENARIGSTRATLQRAVRELAKQSGALFKEIEACSSELAAHDADFSPHEPGWQASTPEHVRDLFARL
jgi:hypothetical protein